MTSKTETLEQTDADDHFPMISAVVVALVLMVLLVWMLGWLDTITTIHIEDIDDMGYETESYINEWGEETTRETDKYYVITSEGEKLYVYDNYWCNRECGFENYYSTSYFEVKLCQDKHYFKVRLRPFDGIRDAKVIG